MSQENKKIVLSYVEAFNRGDIDALCSLFGPDSLVYRNIERCLELIEGLVKEVKRFAPVAYMGQI